jgi:predicted Zn-dependent protease with MMP-like domain
MPRRRRYDRETFAALVRRALASVPPRFRPYVENVTVEVRDRPSPRVRREFDLAPGESLYGLYEGTPLTDRGPDATPLYPDRITIFQDPLEVDYGDDPEEIVRQVRITVLHEIGHHFGLEDEAMDQIET